MVYWSPTFDPTRSWLKYLFWSLTVDQENCDLRGVFLHQNFKPEIWTFGFSGGSDGKESACNAGDPDLIPGLQRSPGEGNGYPFQHSCLENSMDRGAWWATVHGTMKSWTWLNNLTLSLLTFSITKKSVLPKLTYSYNVMFIKKKNSSKFLS